MFEELTQAISSKIPKLSTIIEYLSRIPFVAKILQGYGHLSQEEQKRVKIITTISLVVVFFLFFCLCFYKVLSLKRSIIHYQARTTALMDFEQEYQSNQQKLKEVAVADLNEEFGSAKDFLTTFLTEKMNYKEADYTIDTQPGKRKKDFKEVITKLEIKQLTYKKFLDLLAEIEKYQTTLTIDGITIDRKESEKDELSLKMALISMKKM